jgi:hypothetical protein
VDSEVRTRIEASNNVAVAVPDVATGSAPGGGNRYSAHVPTGAMPHPSKLSISRIAIAALRTAAIHGICASLCDIGRRQTASRRAVTSANEACSKM